MNETHKLIVSMLHTTQNTQIHQKPCLRPPCQQQCFKVSSKVFFEQQAESQPANPFVNTQTWRNKHFASSDMDPWLLIFNPLGILLSINRKNSADVHFPKREHPQKQACCNPLIYWCSPTITGLVTACTMNDKEPSMNSLQKPTTKTLGHHHLTNRQFLSKTNPNSPFFVNKNTLCMDGSHPRSLHLHVAKVKEEVSISNKKPLRTWP